MGKTVLLVDLSALYAAAWFAGVNQEISYAASNTLQMVKRAEGSMTYAGVAICCDSGTSFRKDLSPEYKSNRPQKDPAFIEELRRLQERLEADGYLLWRFPNLEADDIVSTAVKHAREAGFDAVIASADKDLCQLLTLDEPTVSMWNTKTGTLFLAREVEPKFGVPPSLLGDWLALVGDTSDNIKGAPGIGPKKATALLQKFGSLRALLRAVMGPDHGLTEGTLRAIRDNVAQIELARQLVTLRTDAPIRFLEIFERREPKPLTTETPYMSDTTDAEFTETKQEAPPAPKEPGSAALPAASAAAAPGAEAKPAASAVATIATAPTTALVAPSAAVRQSFEMALQPSNAKDAYDMAIALHNSRLFSKFASKEAIFAVMLRGRELGLPALTALDCFHVVEGKPTPQAHLIVSLAQKHPDCEYLYCEETTPERATWVTKSRRIPKEVRLTYSVEDAQRADMVKPKSNWERRPAEMCRKTAAVQLIRMVYPDAALGLVSTEEMGESPEEVAA